MPEKDNLLQAVSQKRSKGMRFVFSGPNIRQFKIPDIFAPFFQQDSGKLDKVRILTFGDATMKNFWILSNTWLVDGASEISPENFCQTATIHVELCHIVYLYCYQKNRKKKL